jgi:integrase/recombinase XerD
VLSPAEPRSISQSLFAALFQFPRVQSRYLDAPLLEERVKYISHLFRHQVPRGQIKATASMQIHAIRLLKMSQPRLIRASELREAGSQWAIESSRRYKTAPSKQSRYNFIQRVKGWLTFSGLLVKEDAPKGPFDSTVTSYLSHLHLNGFSESTILTRRRMLSKFQQWLGERHNNLMEVSVNDIDDYLESGRATGWRQTTLRAAAEVLRVFFRFCEDQNWCRPGIARGILAPRVPRPSINPRGPAWRDVRRMLSVVAENPVELRAKAVISLCSIYALRRSEILRLRLDDFDWQNEIMTVRRMKGGGLQQFPIQHEVGEAVLAYLESGRPRSSCRSLFTTFRVPIRPMGPCSVADIVAKQMKALGIKSMSFGPHALRHSCATQLMNKGFSLHEIADFLGHRGLRAVSIYAKYNPRLLRRVAAFSLAGVR